MLGWAATPDLRCSVTGTNFRLARCTSEAGAGGPRCGLKGLLKPADTTNEPGCEDDDDDDALVYIFTFFAERAARVCNWHNRRRSYSMRLKGHSAGFTCRHQFSLSAEDCTASELFIVLYGSVCSNIM